MLSSRQGQIARMLKVNSNERPAVLLASAASSGTIAAVRYLGSIGFDVGVISTGRLCAAGWSRRVTRTYSAPSESETTRFLEALLSIGRAQPGQILLPTSDETAWLYTAYSSELSKYFRIHQPPIETMQRILDKRSFAETAVAAGIPVLPSWDPQNKNELENIASSLPYPVLIKPRTHVHRFRNDKGIVVCSANELLDRYEQFVDREKEHASDDPLLPKARLPIIQKFVDAVKPEVHSITGFIDRTGELFVTRRSKKVFQRFQPVGVGVCFESVKAEPKLSALTRQLCRALNYSGIFELEFIKYNDQWAAIDFNPRFFNQMGLDIRRGMPLPLFACLEAAGEGDLLREAIAAAQCEDDCLTVFYDKFTLHAILLAQSITSRISSGERAYWHAWAKRNAIRAVDAAADSSDPAPGIVHALSEISLGIRAIPRFLRSTSPVRP